MHALSITVKNNNENDVRITDKYKLIELPVCELLMFEESWLNFPFEQWFRERERVRFSASRDPDMKSVENTAENSINSQNWENSRHSSMNGNLLLKIEFIEFYEDVSENVQFRCLVKMFVFWWNFKIIKCCVSLSLRMKYSIVQFFHVCLFVS